LVKERKSENTYLLDLPERKGYYNVFHVSLLKEAPEDVEVSKDLSEYSPDEDEYEVERILDSKIINKKIHYLVK